MKSAPAFSGGSQGGRPPAMNTAFSGGSQGGRPPAMNTAFSAASTGGRPRWLSSARGLGVASLLALTALAGCANAEPGVAAYVDGIRITDQQVKASVDGIGTTLEEGQQVSTSAVLNAMIYGAISEQLASKNNIAISDADRQTILQGSSVEGLVAVPAARSVAYDLADQQIVSTKLGSEAFLAAVAEQDVTLNPRYGVLDPQQKLIVSDGSGSLARPASPTPEVPQ